MYKVKNNRKDKMFFIDTDGVGVHMEPEEEITVAHPPRDGFGNRLTIEEIKEDIKIKKEKITKEDK